MNYEKIYNDLISKARSEDRKKIKGGIYYEAHHIIPKCMGGEGKAYQHDHPNIILLTAKEHYIAHRLLCIIYPNNKKLRYSLWIMITGASKYNKRYIISSNVYNRLKQEHALLLSTRTISDATKKKLSMPRKGHSAETKNNQSLAAKNRPLRGPMSETQKKKIAESMTGRKCSTETKRRISEAKKGHVHSEETRKKISEKTKGRTAWNKGIQLKNKNKI